MAKGGTYEREVCRRLSRWWTGNDMDDDVFWRSSQSGGRATTRAKSGKSTRGHCGDITAVDGRGQKFVKLITVEIKRGYNRVDPIHLLDRTPKMAQQGFEAFLEQAMSAAARAKTRYWMIIHKRDHRTDMVYIPHDFFRELEDLESQFTSVVEFEVPLRKVSVDGHPVKHLKFAGMRFSDFLAGVKRRSVLDLYEIYKPRK